ncbi:MAG: glycosyltransferase [Gammaproteobacteria bacterium]|nr:glycosyltransferase [Gammaproteobacteria bacterium]MBU1775610.1 glycosyltransferase [Gammaproteobacteria bacterium]MBU1969731.1 glycosyltransferase [Gammaproteobacteria bacterium]
MSMLRVGVVIIGRNEGDRLVRCLTSLKSQLVQLVYVDSGSTDESVKVAIGMGADVVNLDMTRPFTAARARNEGFERMRKLFPQTEYVQFVDGDCEVSPLWLESAVNFADTHLDIAAVCGRRRERFPEKTIYNLLCDMEWDTPIGEAKSCGGDVLMRVDAFESVHGFRPDLIAGEEPELCVRLRASGWRIWRLDQEMTLHDAAITRFGQWWKRIRRSGYAFAEGAHLHGEPPERHRVKESRRAWIWGLGIPVVSVCLAIWLGACGFAMLIIYPVQVVRLALQGTRSVEENWWRALFLVLGKFPEAIGQMNFIYNRLAGKTARLIEYK